MPFIRPEQLKDSVAAALGVRGGGQALSGMFDQWDRICADANNSAYQSIRGALLARGFTDDQINLWDRAEEFSRDVGTYFALYRGGCTQASDGRFIKDFDRRKELEKVQVTNQGVLQLPALGAPSVIGSGVMTDPTGVTPDTQSTDRSGNVRAATQFTRDFHL